MSISITPTNVNSNANDSLTNSTDNNKTIAFGYGYDGTNWDRLRLDSNYNLNTRLQLSPVLNTWLTLATGVTNGTAFYAGDNNYVAIRINTSAFTGTIQWQWSIDGNSWNGLNLTNSTSGTWPNQGTSTPVTSIALTSSSTVLLYHGSIPPNAFIRAGVSAYTTGSVSVTGFFMIRNQILPTSTSGQNLRVQLANGTSELSMSVSGSNLRVQLASGNTEIQNYGNGDGVTATGALGVGLYALNSALTADRLRTASIGDNGSSLGILASGQYLSNGATQFNRARDMVGVTTDTTLGTGIQAVGLVGFEGTSYARIRTVNGVADGATTGLLAQGQYGWNGAGWDRQRVNNIHRYQEYLSLAAGTSYIWWTPTAGKKFRLMSALMGSSQATMLTLRDNTNNIATFNINGRDTKDFQFGNNGYLSSAAGNNLNVFNNSASTITFWLTVMASEE